MSSYGVVDLDDDGFEGSIDEMRIAQEVFYGNVADVCCKSSVATQVASATSEETKMLEASLCSNSETSAVTNQASSKDRCHKDACMMELQGHLGAQSSMEWSVVGARIEHNLNAKRLKLSVNELSNFKPYLDTALTSSMPMKQVVSGIYDPALHPSQILMCHVVESSGEGVTSSCYLLKQYPGSDKDANVLDGSMPNASLVGSDGSAVKQFGGCKSIASPISQESSASKLLVSVPSAMKVSKPESVKWAGRRPKRETSPDPEGDYVLLTTDSMKDSRVLLRSRVFHLLRTAGWSIEKWKRGYGKYRNMYRSPAGELLRELRRVWNVLGQNFSRRCNYRVVADDKNWIDAGHFWSDLYDTLRYIENEIDNWEPKLALSCQWSLLNPFVTVVFIDRKISTLKTGNLGKAKQSVVDVSSNAEVQLKWNCEDVDEKRSADKQDGENFHDSPLASDSAVIEGGQHKQEASEAYKSRSIYVSEGSIMRLVKTVDNITSQSVGTCTDELVHSPSNLPGCVSESASIQFPTCLYDVPVGNANVDMIGGLSETLSPNHGSCMSSPSYKYDLKQTEENAKDIIFCPLERVVEQSGGGVEFDLQGEVPNDSEKVSDADFSKLCEDEGTIFRINETSQFKMVEVQVWSSDNAESEERLVNNLIQSQYVKKSTGRKKREVGRRRSVSCQLKDDDLLISAIIKKRSFKSSKSQCGDESGRYKSKPLKKRKSQKGSCRLLPRSLCKGSKHFKERWSLVCERTVLSWLLSTGAVCVNEPVQYRDPKDDSVVKDGLITRKGILCKCCNEVFSVSGFKIHAGFKQGRPCLSLFMGTGKPYTLCQLQAWSAEYKARKNSTRSIPADEFDENDDSCGLCGDGGELLCCDNCPSTFHQSCLSAEDLPEGSWYCSNCTCRLCGDLVNDKETVGSNMGLKCSHCEQKYHEVCLMDKSTVRVGGSPWFCSIGCEEVYCGLQSRVGLCSPISDGYSWSLLRCIHDDLKIPSPQHFALKAECNSKLAVAVTIMEECFLSMTDPRTGIDMIPQVVYNWGSEFARLDYHGFYTAVLEMDDVLISVACVRVHGVAVAEMPLIATCSKYRRQGMCRRLLDAIEKMLISLKVKKLVIAAIPELVATWTLGFGFMPMEDTEKRSLRTLNLMVFPGTVMLKKTLYEDHPTSLPQGVEDVPPLENDESFKMEVCLEGESHAETVGAQKSSEVYSPMESEGLNTLASECEDKDTNIAGPASEMELDDSHNPQVIEDHQHNGLHVAEDPECVEAAQHTDLQCLPHNPESGVKSKIAMGDKPQTAQIMDQHNPLSSLHPETCLDEDLTVVSEKHKEVPCCVSTQLDNVMTEAEVASERGSSMVVHSGNIRSFSEPKDLNENVIPKLVDSVVLKEGNGVAGCMGTQDISDLVESNGSLDTLPVLEKCLSVYDKCSESALARNETQPATDNENQLSLIEPSTEANLLSQL